MKYSLKKEALPLSIVVLTWLFAVYFYQRFPERVITHWNFAGEADGYSGRGFAAFLFPVISSLLYGLFLFLPRLDPKKENYEKFAKTYAYLQVIFLVFFAVIFLITGLVNLGVNVRINRLVPALVGLLFIALGSLMKNIKQNWFVGFRFPWTLESETVWEKTHRFGGKAMIICGCALAVLPLFGETAGMIIFFSCLLLMVLGTMSYSYFIFRKEQTKKIQG